jgi:hypothetical protein
MWPYDPRPRRLGAGGALTVLRFAPLVRLRPVLGYNARLGVFQVHGWKSADCRTRDSKEGGRLQRRLSSSFFDRFRCRQSLDRGFGMLRSHWSSHFVDLSNVRLIFKHFEQFNIKDPFGG